MSSLMMKNLGYKVLTASTPNRAIQLAGKHRGHIDLLVTDVVMPRMNGRELSVQLRRLRPDLKVLFISGYTADVIVHMGVLDEGVHFLQKPFAPKDLATRIRKALVRE